MAVYRKPYRSGTSVVVAIPYYMLEEMNVERGDYFLLKRIGASTIELVVKKSDEVLKDRYRRNGTWKVAKPAILRDVAPVGEAGGNQTKATAEQHSDSAGDPAEG